jgi:hypothetical protein
MNTVYVCRTCPFTTHDEKTALKHKSPIHRMMKFTEEIL